MDGDAVRLAQVLSNLLDNAAKYTPDKGRISVAVKTEAADVTVEVQDTGMGLEPHDMARIFEPMTQLHESRAASAGGLGLGLSLVRGITELHGGTVRVLPVTSYTRFRLSTSIPVAVSIVVAFQKHMTNTTTSRSRMHLHLRFKPSAGARAAATFGDQPDVIAGALAAVTAGECDEADLNARVLDRGGVDAFMRWQDVLGTWRDENLLDYAVHVNGRWVATIEPLAPGVEIAAPDAGASTASRLSRFAYVRRDHGRTLLESPLAPVRVELGPEALAIALDGSAAAGDALAISVLPLLRQFGFHEPLDRAESPAERVWEFHDALFHRASRLTGANVGATFRLRDEIPPWPALKPRGTSPRIALARPDLDAIAADDAPFTTVLERRRSIRSGGGTPLTIGQLSEFLFRAFRIGAVDRSGAVETVRRVVPAGGGLHELEAYVAVGRCTGLAAGSYWYDANGHALESVGADEEATSALVDQAARSWGRRHPPPDVLITLAARLPRIAWTYERMAYRVVLMNVGAVMQTMYLVATAMRLAPCAVGNGNPDLFARLTGVDRAEETSVGEFALSGSAAP